MEPSVPVLLRQAGDAMVGMFRHTPDFEARIWRNAWMVLTGEPQVIGNWLVIVEPGPAAEEALRGFVAALRERGHPGLVYFPQRVAGQYDALAGDLGLDVPGPVPLMVWRAPGLAGVSEPDGIEIGTITGGATLREAASVIAASFHLPDDAGARLMPAGVLTEPACRVYGAWRDGRIVSAAVSHWGGTLVYIDIMATHPAHQGQGIGRALLGRVLFDSVQQGATHVHLISSVEGRQLYERAGFRVVDEGVTRMVPVF